LNKPNFSCFKYIFTYYSIQTIANVDLEDNPGRCCAAVSNAIRLRNDKVRNFNLDCIICLRIYFVFIQTMKTFNYYQKINDDGIKYLTEVLRNNEVRLFCLVIM